MTAPSVVRTALSAAAFLLLLAPPGARADSSYVFTWHGSVASGDGLDVSNVNGPVRVVQSADGQARVRATVTAQRGDARAVTVAVSKVGRTLYVCPVYPGVTMSRDCKQRGNNTDNNNVRVEFSIELPKRSPLHATTVNGAIDARGIDGDVEAGTVNQDISIETRGTARAKTVNGSIDAAFGARGWSGTLNFATVNGGITVALPRNAAFTLDAGTLNGSITVNGFPLAEKSRGFVGHKVTGSVGGGGGTLALKTVNGPIRLSAR
jgi:hypothetical protein